jgi:hypothetical protein
LAIDLASKRLVDGKSETDVGEQSQSVADVADGELFHGRVSLLVERNFENDGG